MEFRSWEILLLILMSTLRFFGIGILYDENPLRFQGDSQNEIWCTCQLYPGGLDEIDMKISLKMTSIGVKWSILNNLLMTVISEESEGICRKVILAPEVISSSDLMSEPLVSD